MKVYILIKSKLSKLLDKSTLSILTDSVWTTLGRVGGLLSGVLASIYVARVYGPDALGVVSLVNSFLAIITIVTIFGTNTSILRLIPEYNIKGTILDSYDAYKKITGMVFVTSLIFGAGVFLFSQQISENILNKPEFVMILKISSLFLLFKSLLDINNQSIRGLGKKEFYAIMQLFPHSPYLIILLIASLVTYSEEVPVYSLLSAILISSFISFFLVRIIFRRKIKKDTRINSSNRLKVSYKELFMLSLPMCLTDSSFIILSQTGVFFIGALLDASNVGYYAVAVSIATMTNLFVKSINSVVAPMFSELYFSNNLDDIFNIAQNSAKVAFWVTLPVTLILMLFGQSLLELVYGVEYRIAYYPMVFLAIGQLFNAISGSTGSVMNMTGHQIEFRNIMIASVFVNILLSWILIKPFGILGAGIATTITTFFWNVLVLIYMWRKYHLTTAYFPFKFR